jgi:PBSX family phage terminase large subunit
MTTALAIQAQVPTPSISPKQLEFLRGSNKSYNVCEGSVRSGKTVITLVRWLFFIAEAPETGTLVMAGRTRESVWENMIKPLQDETLFGPLAKEVTGTYLSGKVVILGRDVRVIGASDNQAEKVIRGSTVCGACVDEITTLPQNFFDQLCARMTVHRAQLFGTTNPDSPAHWFKTDYLDKIDATGEDRKHGWTRWHFVMGDNPSLDPVIKRRLERQYSGLFHKRFIEGLWVAADGAVFSFWDPAKYVVKHADLPKMRRLYGVGVDYGDTHISGAIFLGLGVDNKLYYVNEWSNENKKDAVALSPHQQAKLLVEFMKKPLLPHPDQADMKPKWVIVDEAAKGFISSLRENGVNNFAKSKKDVLRGIQTMSSMFTTDQLLVSDACVGLIKELPSYVWDSNEALKGIDKPDKKFDDRIDPARYVLLTTQGAWYRDIKANR